MTPTTTLNEFRVPARGFDRAMWAVQALLAALFLFTGSLKLLLPIAELTRQMPLPGPFVRFLGTAELLGALGLVLPGIFGVRRSLTPIAAGGLVIIMIGAVCATVAVGGGATALLPAAVGVLAGLVAWGRRTA